MTGIAEMLRTSLVAAVLMVGCSSAVAPQPCLTDSASVPPAMRWYGARLDEIRGKGTSCQAPVVVKGAYLPCERWSESGRCEYLTPLPMQLRWVLRFWVQTNYSRFRMDLWTREDCGEYEASVVALEGADGQTTRLYIDAREFLPIRILLEGKPEGTD